MTNVYFDGASRGNPGKGAWGFYIDDKSFGAAVLDHCTNNQAEYLGALEALKYCVKNDIKSVVLHGDSKLVINQLNGVWKVKNEVLQEIFIKCKKLISKLESFKAVWIPRSENKNADALCNYVMDK